MGHASFLFSHLCLAGQIVCVCKKMDWKIQYFSPGPDLIQCLEHGNFIFAHLYQEQKGQLGNNMIVSVFTVQGQILEFEAKFAQ